MFGITVGCMIGMLPLLFFSEKADEKTEHETAKAQNTD